MFTSIKNFIYNRNKGLPFLLITLLSVSLFLSFFAENLILKDNFFIRSILILIVTIIIFEIFFVILYYHLNKDYYKSPPIVDFDKIPYKGHPYIPYVLKEHAKGLPPTIANYPLHKGKYKFHSVSTNNLGFCNGENGDRDIEFSKKENDIRINCIGSSTTQNYLIFKNKIFSYPLELEKKLNQNSKIKIEVNNCGQGGYNTADILVRFLLQILDTKPDMIILYQGYADVRSYLSKNFRSDYSHSRYNLSEKLIEIKKSIKIPRTYFSYINFLLDKWFPVNLRHSLVELIHKQNIDLKIEPDEGLRAFKRNIQHIIDICKARNIKIILSTYCHYLYDNIKNNNLSLKYDEIIKKENEIIEELAKFNNVDMVDNYNLIPKEDKYFVDSIHFSHNGMELLARNFASKILEIYDKR